MISNSTTTWVHNYLANQKQCVAVNGVFSDPSYITSSVRLWLARQAEKG